MKKFVDKIEKVEYVLMIIGILIAVVVLFLQVILRYVFSASLSWAEEAARYLFIFFTWIGTSIAATSNQHIRFEVLFNKFPGARKYLELLSTFVCLCVSVFMLYYGIQLILMLLKNVALSPTMKIPMWICYSIIPLAGVLMTIKYLYLMSKDLKECFGGEVSKWN